MSTGIFSVGITGMNAAQLGLLTTEHNITNANTAGFTRQRIGQTAAIALQTGAGFVGQGTSIQTIERVYNDFLQKQINQSQSAASELDTYYGQIKQIDNLLADVNAGLSPALQDFFKGVQQMAADPSSIPGRQAFLSSAQALVTRFQTLEARVSEMYTGVNEQLVSTTGVINSYAQQIANLNQRIVVATAASQQPPNDLLDERDRLISDLNKEIKVTPVMESDGSLSVFIGSGQQLVTGQAANTLEARPSYADGERYAVGLKTGSAYQEMPEYLLTGGNLAGYLRFRSESLDGAVNTMGNIAASMAMTLNAQQSLGQDLLGQTAADAGFAQKLFLFDSVNVPKIIPNTLNTGAGVIALTAATQAGQSDGYAAPGTAGGNFYTQLGASDYELTFGLGGAYSVKRLSDGVSVASAGAGAAPIPISFDGVALTITTVGANGDRFQIQPTREVARNLRVNPVVAADARLVAAAAPVRSGAASTNTGNGVITAPSVAPGYTLPAAPVSLVYSTGTGGFTGFPAGPVSVTTTAGTTNYTYPVPDASIPYTTGATISFGGVSFQISGNPKNNDTFTVRANTGGVSDSRNAVLMGKLQTQNTMLGTAAGGKASFQGVYAQLVSIVGNKTREVQVTGEAQKTLLSQAQSARDSQSGVNLDEEAANLLRFQYSYQASAKMLQVGTKLFDTILSIGA